MLTFHEKTALGFAQKSENAKDEQGREWFMKSALKHAAQAGLTLQQIETKAAAIETQNAAQNAALETTEEVCDPCAVKAIRYFFAVCKNAGIDTTNSDLMRGAFSTYFGRKINTRRDLTADMWLNAANAIERGHLIF
jgi:hypothetical protein